MLLYVLLTMCGPLKRFVECSLDVVIDQCPNSLQALQEYTDSFKPDKPFVWPNVTEMASYVDNYCDLKGDFHSRTNCVVDVVRNSQLTTCIEDARMTRPDVETTRCSSYFAGKICAMRYIGQSCGNDAAYFYATGLPFIFKEFKINCESSDEVLNGLPVSPGAQIHALQEATGSCEGLQRCLSLAKNIYPSTVFYATLTETTRPEETLSHVLVMLCGSLKKFVLCSADVLDQCPNAQDHIEEYLATLKPSSNFIWPGIAAMKTYMENYCGLEGDFQRRTTCVTDVVKTSQLTTCIENARMKAYDDNTTPCLSYFAGKRCAMEHIGQNCGDDAALFYASGLPFIFKEFKTNCESADEVIHGLPTSPSAKIDALRKAVGPCNGFKRCLVLAESIYPSTVFYATITKTTRSEETLSHVLVMLCGPMKKFVQCSTDVLAQCPHAQDHIEQYLMTFKPGSNFIWPGFVAMKTYVENRCGLESDFERRTTCVTNVVKTSQLTSCIEYARMKTYDANTTLCSSYFAGKQCALQHIGEKCGTDAARFYATGLPFIYTEFRADCEPAGQVALGGTARHCLSILILLVGALFYCVCVGQL